MAVYGGGRYRVVDQIPHAEDVRMAVDLKVVVDEQSAGGIQMGAKVPLEHGRVGPSAAAVVHGRRAQRAPVGQSDAVLSDGRGAHAAQDLHVVALEPAQADLAHARW